MLYNHKVNEDKHMKVHSHGTYHGRTPSPAERHPYTLYLALTLTLTHGYLTGPVIRDLPPTSISHLVSSASISDGSLTKSIKLQISLHRKRCLSKIEMLRFIPVRLAKESRYLRALNELLIDKWLWGRSASQSTTSKRCTRTTR